MRIAFALLLKSRLFLIIWSTISMIITKLLLRKSASCLVLRFQIAIFKFHMNSLFCQFLKVVGKAFTKNLQCLFIILLIHIFWSCYILGFDQIALKTWDKKISSCKLLTSLRKKKPQLFHYRRIHIPRFCKK